MSERSFDNVVSLKLTLGHVLVLWDLLQGKLAQVSTTQELGPGQTRALWAFEDICERALIANGLSSRPDKEWSKIVGAAEKFAESIPADYVD